MKLLFITAFLCSLATALSNEQMHEARGRYSVPRVHKFQESIYYDVYYNESAVYDYVNAFYVGYQMQDYAYADECLQYTTEGLDVLHELHLNLTRRIGWSDPWFLTTNSMGNSWNDAWFYCYQY